MRRLTLLVLLGLPALAQMGYKYTAGGYFSNFPTFTNPTGGEPTKGNCVTDSSVWNATVCKAVDVVTDIQPTTSTATVARPPYSRWAVDNADGSKYYVVRNAEYPTGSGKGQMLIYNSDNTLYSVPALNGLETREFRWDPADPLMMYYRSGCKFYSYRVDTAVSTQLHDFSSDFPACVSALNDVEGDPSLDGRYWPFMILGTYQYGTYPMIAIVVYDKTTDTIVGTLDKDKYVSQGGGADLWDTYGYRPNMVDMAPTGDRVVLLWPAVKYPAAYAIGVSSATVSSGAAAISGGQVYTRWFSAGDAVRLSCSGGAAILTGNYTLSAVSTHSLTADISASGLADGTYTCAAVYPALTQIVVSGGVATATTGAPHRAVVGYGVILGGTGVTALNVTVTPTSVTERTFTFSTSAADGTYTATGMTFKDSRYGAKIPDDDFSYPSVKASNTVANDAPHAYNLDFTNPVKLCNDETHSGWAWALDGTPVYLCQINGSNWNGGEVDTFGFTNLYTGDYVPIMRHSDLNYQGGMHFGRFYDPKIRGWGMMSYTQDASDTNALRGQLVMLELKHYNQNPEIWRVGYMYNIHTGYETEGHGPLSRDGLKFRWGGAWPGGDGTVDTLSLSIPLRIKTRGSVVVTPASTTAAISYIGSTTDACTVTASANSSLSPALETLSDGGGAQSRSLTIGLTAALSPSSTYYYQVACGTYDTMTGSFTTETSSGALTVATTALVSGVAGAAYSQTLAASGGTAPYTWSLASGTLPAGLGLSSGGEISGTPTTAGTYSITVRATDSSSATADAELSISIAAAPAVEPHPAISTTGKTTIIGRVRI